MPVDLGVLGLFAAFGAGLLSFLSPCVAPLVPGYLSLVSGSAGTGSDPSSSAGRRVFIGTVFFVAGFTLVFVVLGASASALGGALEMHRRTLNIVAGAVMILMGLFILGAFQIPWLYREKRFHLTPTRALTRSETMLLGMAFGFGWTPCIGPFLASILIYTSTAETVGQGTLLLLAYSLGLGLPFLLMGLGVGRAVGMTRWVTRHYRVVSSVGGVTLILMGGLFVTDRFFHFSIAVQRLYYQVFDPLGGALFG